MSFKRKGIFMNTISRQKKIFISVILGIIITGLFFYLSGVFLASVNISTYHGISAKPGRVIPEPTDECRVILKDVVDMNPWGFRGRPGFPIEFREYANIWLLDGAKTWMYEKAILQYPTCFNHLLNEMNAARQDIILVIFDRHMKEEFVIIRNKNRLSRPERG